MGENLLADVVASYQEERHPPGQYLGLEDEEPATLAEGSDGDQCPGSGKTEPSPWC